MKQQFSQVGFPCLLIALDNLADIAEQAISTSRLNIDYSEHLKKIKAARGMAQSSFLNLEKVADCERVYGPELALEMAQSLDVPYTPSKKDVAE